jgi:hypothetical protein
MVAPDLSQIPDPDRVTAVRFAIALANVHRLNGARRARMIGGALLNRRALVGSVRTTG